MDTITHNSKVGQWLFAHEMEYGFGHGLKSEAWHLQWFVGDNMPQAVLDFEAHPWPRAWTRRARGAGLGRDER